jgi:hypothetical protein
MLKFKAGPLIGLGLSRANINLLLEGKPIRIYQKDVDPKADPNAQIAIMFGETEETLFNELKAAGFIGPDSKITGKCDAPNHRH